MHAPHTIPLAVALDDTPLSIAALPAVLAGPILRRLTRTQITVWAALSKATDVKLSVGRAGQPLQDSAPVTPTHIGSNLWVVAITKDGIDAGEFTAGTRYEYKISSPGWPAEPDWSTLRYSAVFPADQFPSFRGLPANLADLNLFHASCRKPHGNGRDALALASDLIADQKVPLPHFMMLSGDQIYADDVAAPLTKRIQRISADLVGINESGVFTALANAAAPEWKVNGRADASMGFGLTSGAAENHLWTLGEFFAMYLLAWSDTLWPATVPAWSAVTPVTDIAPPPAGQPPRIDEKEWSSLAANLGTFKDGVPKVRRLLANVPSLMICDDHEVTDDWNIDFSWAKTVYSNAAGSRLITNALTAYVLFQHLGNRPDRFAIGNSPEHSVLTAVAWTGNSPDTPALRTALGVPAALAPAPPLALRDLSVATGIRYDYTLGAADGYPLRLVVLDERTARSFATIDSPSARISQPALDLQLPALAANPTEHLLLVAPAPVLGVRLVEHYLQPAGGLVPGGSAAVDFESWAADDAALEMLLDRIADYKEVTILSGDVHYGGAMQLAYEKPPGAIKGRAAQLTASSTKNADSLTIILHVFGELAQKLGILRRRSFRGFTTLTPAQRTPLQSPPPAGSVLPYDDTVDVLLGRVFRAGVRSPAVFSEEVAQAYALPQPDWRYTVEHVDDETLPTAAGILADLNPGSNLAAWTGWDATKSYIMVRALRASDLHRIGMMLTGLPQFAHIWFTTAPNLTVHQKLFVPVGEGPETEHAMVETERVFA